MGLDMYLAADKYVGGWNHSEDEEKDRFHKIIELVGMTKLVTSEAPAIHVRTNVAYWRKANAIHAWFVRELAEGLDECQSIHVPVEAMEQLIAQCKNALLLYENDKTEEAGKVMQPQEGFFFGETTIGEGWAEDLRETIAQLEPLIQVSDEFDFYYQASW